MIPPTFLYAIKKNITITITNAKSGPIGYVELTAFPVGVAP